MSKLVTIEEEVAMCFDCPRLRLVAPNGLYECCETGRVVGEPEGDIPEWCPLEDWDE